MLAILLIVGGASWNEYRKAQERAAAQALGDAIVAALANDAPEARAEALNAVTAGSPGGAALLRFLTAAALTASGKTADAVAELEEVARTGELPEIYRQIAAFKALTLQTDSLPAADRRLQFEALAQPGAPLRLLAEEQLALIDIAEGQSEAAIGRLQAILQDAETSADLQQRAAQAIVALGGEPQRLPGPQG